MIRLRLAALASMAGMFVLFAGCGSNSPAFNDTPVIISLFPSSASAGGPGFTLNIAGNGFISTSVVYWNNSPRTTTFNTTSTQLSISVTAQDIATPGTAQIVVASPSPGGGPSTAVNFTINPAQNPQPTITSISPSSTAVGVLPPGGLLTVNGTNFISGSSGSSVAFNGNFRSSNFVSATQLTVPMSASDVASNTTINVTVSNPAPGGGVSNSTSFKVGTGSSVRLKASAMAGAPFPEVVSISSLGGPSNGASSTPAVSSDGRFVAFYSTATNLVAQGSSGNIFARDMCLGAADCSPRTIAVDLAPDGSAPNAGAVSQVAISADGRFVAFASTATNLVTSDFSFDSYSNVYLRDLCTGVVATSGCVPHTELVSIGMTGDVAAGASTSPSLSADGRFVAFVSTALNLVAGAASEGNGVYVRDTCAGVMSSSTCVPHTYSVFLESNDRLSAQKLSNPVISADGRYVAFEASSHAAPGGPNPSVSEVFLADTCLGSGAPAVCTPSNMQVSIAADGSPLTGQNRAPSVSADARYVAFESSAPGSAPDVFLRDTCLGATDSSCVPSTVLLLQSAGAPYLSSNGRYVSFVAATAANSGSLGIYDTCFGASVACSSQAYQITADTSGAVPSPVTSDGSFMIFVSSASNSGLPLSGLGDVLLTTTPF